MEYFYLRGIRLAADVVGEGRELIVLLHGVGADRTTWKYQLEPFSKAGYRVVAIDFRGSGKSNVRSKNGKVLDINRTEFACDVDAIIRQLGYDRAHWVGNSLGGVVILEALRLKLDSLDKVVIANSFAEYPDSAETLKRPATALRTKSLSQLARERIPSVLSRFAKPEDIEEAIDAMATKDPEAYLASWATTWSPHYREMLPSIKHPTLVLSATLDTITPIALSDEIAHGISGAKHVTIPDAGHLSHLENPEVFNKYVLEFLK